MDTKAPIFEKTYQDYLARVNRLDLEFVAGKTGCQWTGKSLIVPLFGTPHSVSKSGILDPSEKEPTHAVKVVLCQYLLQHPESRPTDGT